MPPRGNPTPVLRRQLVRALIATFFVFYVVALMGVTMQSCQVRRQVKELRQEVNTLQEKNEQLKSELDYVKSDAYAEKVARDELKWSREGEHVFVPVPVPGTAASPAGPMQSGTPTPAALSLPSLAGTSHWGEWVRFFFGGAADQSAP